MANEKANENENRELTAEELESVSAGDGISRLVAVSTLKADEANKDAMAGATTKDGPHKIR